MIMTATTRFSMMNVARMRNVKKYANANVCPALSVRSCCSPFQYSPVDMLRTTTTRGVTQGRNEWARRLGGSHRIRVMNAVPKLRKFAL